jgi:hypothetical protein
MMNATGPNAAQPMVRRTQETPPRLAPEKSREFRKHIVGSAGITSGRR